MIWEAVLIIVFGVMLDDIADAQTPWCTFIGVVFGAALILLS